MTQFTFRLETLRKLRESERQQRRQELAEAYLAEERIQQQIATMEGEQEETRKRSTVAASPGSVSVDRLLDTHRYQILLQSRFQHLEGQRDRIREELDCRRQALVEADREVRVLEKLREKQQAVHRAEEEKREMKERDEIAQRHVRPAES
ncbi:MAG: flagellar export protein FliJ [Pirellulaceae bacterium]